MQMRIFGSGLLLCLMLMVYGGIRFVTKLGIVFVMVVFYTLLSFYVGICTVEPDERTFSGCGGEVTGLNAETLWENMGSHYARDVHFGILGDCSYRYRCRDE